MPDSYFPLDVNFFDHPKVIERSDTAVRLCLAAIGYANRYLTDGYIAPPVPGRLISIPWDSDDRLEHFAEELVRAVLWHKAGDPCPRGHVKDCPEFPGADGWRIHDFLEHNRSKEKRLEAQKAERDRKAAWREKQRKDKNDADAVMPDGPVSGDAGVPRDGDAGVPRLASVTGTPNTETETETKTKDKINPVVAQARPIDDTTAVFQAWQDAARKPRARLDDKRRRIIKAALKHYPLDDVLDAVRGWRHSPHHCGQNNTGTVYNDLELLLRDSAHIERFRDLERDGPAPVVSKQTAQAMRTSAAMRARARARAEEVNHDRGAVGRSGGPAERGLPAPAD